MRRIALGLLLIGAMAAASCSRRDDPDRIFRDRSITELLNKLANEKPVGPADFRAAQAALNSRGSDGSSPLLWLLMHGRNVQEGARQLVRAGANPHQFSDQLHTSPAVFAVRSMDASYLRAMIGGGMDVNFRYSQFLDAPTLLFSAVLSHDAGKVETLLMSGADIEARNASGDTPLLYVRNNQYDVAILLLRHGANPRARDNQGDGVCYALRTNPYTPYGTDTRHKYVLELHKLGVECGQLPATGTP